MHDWEESCVISNCNRDSPKILAHVQISARNPCTENCRAKADSDKAQNTSSKQPKPFVWYRCIRRL